MATLKTLLLLSSLLLAGQATASEKRCDPDDKTSCLQAIRPGEPAPFAGILLTPRRAANITAQAERCEAETAHAVSKHKALYQLDIDRLTQLRDSDRMAWDQKEKVLKWGMDSYKERFSPKWYNHPAVWYALGIVSAGAVVGVSVWALEARKPEVIRE